jgi:tetratricopeptide (TPR) repeat protein
VAERLLREALTAPDPDYEHFVLQHLGKTLLDQGRPGEAAAYLERALELRQATGDTELIRSTQSALERARTGPGV